MRELWINDRLLDLDESTVVVLTYQVNDIAELEDRQANYSNRFKVPATASNTHNLGFSNTVNTASVMPYRKSNCNYFEGGVQLIKNGVIIIDSFDGNSFDLTIYSGIYDFFSQIGDKTLKDLDFSELDFEYTNTLIRNNNQRYMTGRDANNNSFIGFGNICFPVIDWGVMPYVNWIDVRYLQPAIRFSYIIDKIFDLTDYTYSGQITEDDIFSAMAVTLSPDEQTDQDALLLARSFKTGISAPITNITNVIYTSYPKIVNLLSYFTLTTPSPLFGDTDGLMIYDNVNSGIVNVPTSYNPPEVLSKTRYRSKTFTTIEVDINLYFTYGEFYRQSGIDNNGYSYLSYALIIEKNGIFYRTFQILPDSDGLGFYFNASASIDLKPNDEIRIVALALK